MLKKRQLILAALAVQTVDFVKTGFCLCKAQVIIYILFVEGSAFYSMWWWRWEFTQKLTFSIKSFIIQWFILAINWLVLNYIKYNYEVVHHYGIIILNNVEHSGSYASLLHFYTLCIYKEFWGTTFKAGHWLINRYCCTFR